MSLLLLLLASAPARAVKTDPKGRERPPGATGRAARLARELGRTNCHRPVSVSGDY
jgi:hypothetical protein